MYATAQSNRLTLSEEYDIVFPMKKLFLPLVLVLPFFLTAQAQEPAWEIEVTGKLTLEKTGEKENLVLHTTTGETLQLTGALTDRLKQKLFELGETNRIVLKGSKNGQRQLQCENKYGFSQSGEQMVETICIVVSEFEPSEIVTAGTSNEPLPPPLRDKEHERFVREQALRNFQQRITPGAKEVTGIILSSNASGKKGIRFIEVKVTNARGKSLKQVFILNENVRISRRSAEQNEELVSKDALRPGQQVIIAFMQDERKPRASQNEAFAITIVKEADQQ